MRRAATLIMRYDSTREKAKNQAKKGNARGKLANEEKKTLDEKEEKTTKMISIKRKKMRKEKIEDNIKRL